MSSPYWLVGRLLVIALALSHAMPASARLVTGTISRTVVDGTGSMAPGAAVLVTSEATSDARTTVTDSRGDFQVPKLLAGRYSVKGELQSFRTYERTVTSGSTSPSSSASARSASTSTARPLSAGPHAWRGASRETRVTVPRFTKYKSLTTVILTVPNQARERCVHRSAL
jgi:hypothetical protein